VGWSQASNQVRETSEARAKLKALKAVYDRLHSQLQSKSQLLHQINSQVDKMTKPTYKPSTAFMHAQDLLGLIKETESRADEALSQQRVLLHVSERCRDETIALDHDVTELQLARIKLDGELQEAAAISRTLKCEISKAEAALSKIADNIEKGGSNLKRARNDFAKLNGFRSSKLAKQERRTKQRERILSQVGERDTGGTMSERCTQLLLCDIDSHVLECLVVCYSPNND